MLDTYITGSTKKKRALIDDALRWYIKRNINRFKNLEITIQIKRMDVCGLCYRVDDRSFIVDINSQLSDEELLLSLFHEMTHVKQYLKNKLKQDGFSLMWNGKDHQNTDYYDQPWEKEAHLMENKLLNEYLLEKA